MKSKATNCSAAWDAIPEPRRSRQNCYVTTSPDSGKCADLTCALNTDGKGRVCSRCGKKGVEVDLLHEICTDCVITSVRRERINELEKLTRQLDSRLSWCQVVGDTAGEEKVKAERAELFRVIEGLQGKWAASEKD